MKMLLTQAIHIFTIARNCQNILHGNQPYSHESCIKITIFPYSCQHLILPTSFCHWVRLKWNLLIFHCFNFVITNEIKHFHLFMGYLFFFFVYFLFKYLLHFSIGILPVLIICSNTSY